jgi:hypothetical protein
MSVGVMERYKLRDLRASHWVSGRGKKSVSTGSIARKRKKINVLVKECFGAVLPEPVEGMRDRWAG